MKIKVEDVMKDIEEAKVKSNKDQEALDKIVRPNTVVAYEYRKYLKTELENNWKSRKGKVKEQVKHLRKKYEKRKKEDKWNKKRQSIGGKRAQEGT